MSLFGWHFVTVNIHLLRHLPDDALRRGAVDRHSCFKYENVLKSIKKKCTGTKNPLKTLSNKFGDVCVVRSNVGKQTVQTTTPEITKRNTKDGIVFTCKIGNLVLSTRHPDCYFRDKNQVIYKVISFEQNASDGRIFIISRRLDLRLPAWTINLHRPERLTPQGLSSCELGIFLSRGMLQAQATEKSRISLDEVDVKYLRISNTTNYFVFYPIMSIS